MLRRLQRQGLFRYVCVVVSVLLCIGALSILPTIRVTADAGVACEGNNLRVNWIGLNPPVTVIVNGSAVVAAGAASGSTVVNGPGSWSVEVLQFGELVGTYNASCPGGPEATRDPRRIFNGSDAGLNVPYRRTDGGFDLWTYDPRSNVGRLLVSVPCEQQQAAARQSAQQHARGGHGNVDIFEGRDTFGRTVTVIFVWPDQIFVSGFFADGVPHKFSFTACADARTIDPRPPTSTATPTATFTATFTQTPIPPRLRIVSAGCGQRGDASFVIRNEGGNMLTTVNLLAYSNDLPATHSIDRLRLNANQEILVRVFVAPGSTASLRVLSDPPISASVDCLRPTATFTPTFTQTPIPPRLTIVSAGCGQRGDASFVIRNEGGNMLTTVNLLAYSNDLPATHSVDRLRLNANQEVLVRVFVAPGSTASLRVLSDPPISASVDCLRPTATFTATPSTPLLRITGSCDSSGVATFVIRNEGTNMTNQGVWVLTRDGINQGGERFTLAAGGRITITRQGLYGNLEVTANNGLGTLSSASTVCQRPA